jgi:hypothetical protein
LQLESESEKEISREECNNGILWNERINFTNILLVAFRLKILQQKSTKLKCKYKKVLAYLLYEKIACKILVKLTQGVTFTNILCAAFSHESFAISFFVLEVKVKLLIGAIALKNVDEIDTRKEKE